MRSRPLVISSRAKAEEAEEVEAEEAEEAGQNLKLPLECILGRIAWKDQVGGIVGRAYQRVAQL